MSEHQESSELLEDKFFRRIVLASTMLSFAATGAAGASYRLSEGMFVWHWTIIPAVIVSAVAAWYLWHLALAAHTESTPQNKRRFIRFGAFICVCGVLIFLLPVFAVAGEKFQDLVKGLTTAAIFLGGLAWVMVKFISAFQDPKEKETEK